MRLLTKCSFEESRVKLLGSSRQIAEAAPFKLPKMNYISCKLFMFT